MPFMDRSIFLDELKRNPALITRLNTIVNGEVGRGALLDKKIIQLETIFNRAAARGQTLEKVTRMYTGPGSDGYYPQSTFSNGAVRSQNEANAFNEQVLKPVLGGSDRSTDLLGFAATGNASGGVAARGKGTRYTRYADMGGETYVQEGRLDNIDRLNRYASGGTIPRPPADIPMTDVQLASAQPYTRDIQRAYPGRNYQPPTQVGIEGGAPGARVPLPAARPAPQTAAAPQTQRASLGNAIAQMFAPSGGTAGFPGSRDDLPYDYVDPNTGSRIINPTGSGELAMGLTRDIGRPQVRVSRPMAPAPQRPAPTSPPDQRGAASVNPPRGPVSPTPRPAQAVPPFPETGGVTADEAQRRPLMPFDPRMFDTTPTAAARPANLSGLTPGGVPMAEDPVGLTPSFDVKQAEPNLLRRAADYFNRSPPMWVAPPEAGLLAAPAPSPRSPQPLPQEDASLAFSRGGNKLTPSYVPTTVDQQLGGLSPFGTTPPQSTFASNTLLPFDQWPPIGWGFNWAGPSFDFGAWG